RYGGCGCSCPPHWVPARRSGPGFRAARLPVRESALRCFWLDVAGGAMLLLPGFHIADEIVRRALLAHGEFRHGKCGPMGRYSWSTAVSLIVPPAVIAHDVPSVFCCFACFGFLAEGESAGRKR